MDDLYEEDENVKEDDFPYYWKPGNLPEGSELITHYKLIKDTSFLNLT